jgi:quercetin dioxygenase-like cupin family protein
MTSWTWTAAAPMPVRYAFVAHDAGAWRPTSLPWLEARSLGMDEASDGAMAVTEQRPVAGAAGGWHRHDGPFRLRIVTAGTLDVDVGGGRETLGRWDVAVQPPGVAQHDIAWSPDLRLIEFLVPSEAAVIRGPGTPGGWISRESTDAYRVGDGPRAYFGYRDLGTAAITDRRLHLHIVKATKPMPGGTGWHHHSMGQIFVVLNGWATLAVERHQPITMQPGDAMCIGAGMRHDVPAFAGDYAVLELCIPADYVTQADDPPA